MPISPFTIIFLRQIRAPHSPATSPSLSAWRSRCFGGRGRLIISSAAWSCHKRRRCIGTIPATDIRRYPGKKRSPFPSAAGILTKPNIWSRSGHTWPLARQPRIREPCFRLVDTSSDPPPHRPPPTTFPSITRFLVYRPFLAQSFIRGIVISTYIDFLQHFYLRTIIFFLSKIFLLYICCNVTME